MADLARLADAADRARQMALARLARAKQDLERLKAELAGVEAAIVAPLSGADDGIAMRDLLYRRWLLSRKQALAKDLAGAEDLVAAERAQALIANARAERAASLLADERRARVLRRRKRDLRDREIAG
jgi:hypothetical protein